MQENSQLDKIQLGVICYLLITIPEFFSTCRSRIADCVTIQKIAYFLTVMPDLIRHPDV